MPENPLSFIKPVSNQETTTAKPVAENPLSFLSSNIGTNNPYRSLSNNENPTGFESTFKSRFNTGLVAGIDPDSIRRDNQKWYDIIGSSALQTASEIGLGTLEGIGYLSDLQQWKNVLSGSEKEFTNWFSESMNDAKQYIKENVAPIYIDQRDIGFKPLDGRWWASNFPTIGTSISLLLPTLGATKVAGTAGKVLAGEKLLAKLSKPVSNTVKGLTAAGFSRYMESTIEAHDTFKNTYQTAINSGKNDTEAADIAGNAASMTFGKNMALLAFDAFQYGKLFKSFNLANSTKLLTTKKILKDLAQQGLSEGTEEVFQYIASKEAERKALIDSNIIQDDKRVFADRVIDYAKEPDIWTSFLFGALGGIGFGAIGNYISNKDARKRLEYAQTLKPSVEYEKAILNNNKNLSNIVGDQAFIELVKAHSDNGTLHKLEDYINEWSSKYSEKTDEELANENITKESIEEAKNLRLNQVKKANEIYDRVYNENINEDLKQSKFLTLLGKEISIQRKNQNNLELENILNKIASEKNLTPELIEIKKLQALRNAYIDTKNSQQAKSLNSQIDELIKQAKTINPQIDIREQLTSSYTDELHKKALDVINNEKDIFIFDDYINKFSNKEGVEQIEKEIEELKNISIEEKLKNLKEAITPNININDLNNLEKIAYKLGKDQDFNNYKENYLNSQQDEVGTIDINSPELEKLLLNRYNNRNLLMEHETSQLSKKLRVPGIDEYGIVQKLNENPKNRKIIEDFYNDINSKILNRLNTTIPEFSGINNTETTESIEVPYISNNDQLKRPFLTVGEEFNFIKTERGYITDYYIDGPKKGFPKPSTKENIVNWQEVNKPEFGLKNTKVYYEVDLSSNYNNTIEGKNKYQTEIQIVTYKDNNTLNKSNDNRIIIGTLPAYKEGSNWSDINESLSLKALREKINDIIKNNKDKTGVIETNISSTIANKLPGRVRNTGVFNSPHEILNENEKLIFGVGRRINNVPILDVPGIPAGNITNYGLDIIPGKTYMIIKSGNNSLVPVELYTKKLSELPELFDKAKDIISNIKTLDDWTNGGKEALTNIIGFPKDNIRFSGEVLVFIDGAWKPLIDEQVLQNMIAQVDVNKINKGDYNNQVSRAGILTTRVSPGNHFHSVKFEIDSSWTSLEVIQEQKIIEPNININQDSINNNNPFTSSKFEKINIPTFGKLNTNNEPNKFKLSIDDFLYEKWNKDKELLWLKNNLPNIPVSVIDNIHEIYKNGSYIGWGVFKNASIYIWKNAGKGTGYHEAFHAVFNLYLNDSDKKLILDEASSVSGINRDNINKLEEYLADRFSDYIITNKESEANTDTLFNRIKKFFNSLYELIKSIFTSSLSIDILFNRINEGYYANKELKLNSYNNESEKFKLLINPKLKEHYIKVINTQFFEELDLIRNNYPEYRDLNDIELLNSWGRRNNMNGVLAIYSSVLNQFIDYFENENNPISSREAIANENNTGIIQNFLTVKNGVITGIGDFLISSLIDLGNYGIKVSFDKINIDNKSDNPLDEKLFEIEEDENSYEGWEIKTRSISSKEFLSYDVRKLLRRTLEGRVENNVFKPILDPIFGKPIFVNFDEIYNYLERNLADIYDTNTMMERLQQLKVYKPSIESIYNKLQNNENLKSQFFSNFAKAHIKYSGLKQYYETRIYGGEPIENITWKIFNSNRNDIRRVIINDWSSNLKNKLRSELVDINGDINKIVAIELNNNFKSLVSKIKSTKKISNEDIDNLLTLLYNIGIDISVQEIKSIISDKIIKEKGIEYNVNGVDNFINTLTGNNNSIDILFNKLSLGTNPFEGKDIEVNAINNLVNIKLNYSNDLIQSAFINVDGENEYSHRNPTFLSKMIKDIKSGDYISKHLQDPYFKRNKWLKDLVEDSTLDIDYTYIDGLQYTDSNGIRYSKMNTKDFEISSLNMWLGSEKGGQTSKLGWYRLPILADSPTMAFVKFKKYQYNEIIDLLYEVALQEKERIDRVKSENSSGIYKIKNYHTNTNYNFLTFLNGKDIDIENKDQVITLITEWIEEEFKKELTSLRELEVLKENSLTFNISSKARIFYGNNDISLLKDYFTNQVFGNIQLFQLLHADPSFYKESDLQAGKRNNQVIKPGILLNTSNIKPYFNTVYFNDVLSTNEEFITSVNNILQSLKYPKEKINSIISQYKEVNTTDAQSFITLDRWKEIQVGLGRWNDKLEKVFNRLKTGKILKEDYNTILQPIKPFYFNHEYVQGRIIPVQNKNSETILLPQIAEKSKLLSNLLKFMEKNSIDSVQFNSAVKTGEYGTMNIEDIDKVDAIIHKLSNNSYSLQQEVPEHHIDTENLYGTQIRKLALVNIDKDKKYINDLTGNDIVKIYNDIIDLNLKEDYEEVAKRFENISSISSLIKEEIKDRNMGENILELADIERDSNNNLRFKYPLYFPTQSQRTESLLSSIFKNKVTKQKINGGSFVLSSNLGFSDELKIVFNEENNSIDYMEVMMPWWSKEFAPLNSKGEIDMSKIDKNLLDIIGYRIPTEGAYSVKRIRVKKFLPKESGGIIILPSEATKIAGEDFDIDKLYTLLYNFSITDGRAVKIKYDFSRPVNEQSRDARDNALIDITKALWSSSDKFTDIIEPGGFDVLKTIRNRITLGYSGESIALPSQQRNIFEKNSTASNLIGIFANHNVNHAVSQNFTLSLKGLIKFDNNEFKELNKTLDTDNNLISRNISMLVSAAVDNAKDPVLNDLNINLYTSDILCTLLRVGYSMETSLYFINQPIIKEFLKRYLINQTKFKENKIFGDLYNEYSNNYLNLSNEEYLPDSVSNLSTSEMLNDVRSIGQPTKEYYKRQLKVLKNFELYKDISSKLSTFVSITRADNIGSSKSIVANQLFLTRLDKAVFDDIIDGIEDVFKDTNYKLVNSFTEYGIRKPTQLLNNFFPYNNVVPLSVKNQIEYNTQKLLNEKEINHLNKEMVKFFMSNFYRDVDFKELIDNLPDRLEKYINNNYAKLESFKIIENLKIVQLTNELPYKRIIFNNNISLTNEQKDYLMNSWEYMIRYGNEEEIRLAEDLIKYSFITSGYEFSNNSFSHLIPHSYLRLTNNSYNEIFIDELYKIQERTKEMEFAHFYNQYVKNNFENSNIVTKLYSDHSAILDYKVTVKGNITSFRTTAKKGNPTFIGFQKDSLDNKETIPVFKEYISIVNNNKTRLYHFSGLSDDINNTAVYNIVETLGIPNFSSEYNMNNIPKSIFSENHIPNLSEDYFYTTKENIIDQFIDGYNSATNNEVDNAINKCK